MKKTTILVLVLACALSGCSTTQWSHEVPAAYISPSTYSHLDCRGLQAELSMCRSRLSSVSSRQDSAKRKDEQMAVVSWLLFWPAMFAIQNEDHSTEIADLKGRVNALQGSIAQKCN